MVGRINYSRRAHEKAGQPPGTPLFIGRKKMEEVRVSYIRYNENLHEEKDNSTPKECADLCKSSDVVWINIEGIHDAGAIEEIGELFNIHSLTVEDILNTMQRPKFEDFDSYLFIVLKMLSFADINTGMDREQVCMILGENFVITFQEKPGDVFDTVREQIRGCRGRIRREGADYLAYALIDAVVDSYFLILETIGDQIEEIEDQVILTPDPDNVSKIHRFKRAMLFMRRTVWPLREEIALLEKSGSDLVRKSTAVFLRNLYDHTIQVIDTVETYRDVISGMHDMYLSSVSNRMNQIMKVLTIIATIFIPLTFISGVYGMNFRYMPEINWRWGYFVILGFMLAVSIVMLSYFKKKKWI
ncbi:MAG: magnesium/cobalt transporter CorA [Candidatus Fermentibacteraceae bacterium]|nr:magnesium/cobalt transporter CorA [Candidatus Fermentibacteraceae bacterium]